MTARTCSHCGTAVPEQLHFCPKCDQPAPSQIVAAALKPAPAVRAPAPPAVRIAARAPPSNNTSVFVVFSALIAAGGCLFVSQATLGVAAIALAILVSIWARMAQSSYQHAQLLALMAVRESSIANPGASPRA